MSEEDFNKDKELTKKEKFWYKMVYGVDGFISVVLFIVFLFAVGRIIYDALII